MALPVSSDADGDEDLFQGSAGAVYSQIPDDHFSDSSESSDGHSDDLHTFDTPDAVTASPNVATGRTLNTGSFLAHNAFVQNCGSVAHIHGAGGNGGSVEGLDNRAASHNHDSHINAVQEEMQNGGVLHGNVGRDLHVNHMQSHAAAADSRHAPNIGHVVQFDGMEIHVYGQLAGFQLSATPHHTNTSHGEGGGVGDIEETARQREEDTAMLTAKEEEHARRSAPLPPERCEAIRNAMQSISLGSYRPEWADKIPEEQWLHRLRRR